MTFTHILATRPRQASLELANLLKPLGLKTVVQPAFDYRETKLRSEQPDDFEKLSNSPASDLLIFNSPRSVEFGLAQLPPEIVGRMTVAAIGPSTAQALSRAGVRVGLVPKAGYTSEDLLESLAASAIAVVPGNSQAWIVAAPGGRKKLQQGLEEQGWICRILFAYRAQPAELDKEVLGSLQDARGVLTIWTSSNSMKSLSQRLSPSAWFQLCQGDWLVVSERLRRLARAYGPARIHLAAGPDNASIAAGVRTIINESKHRG